MTYDSNDPGTWTGWAPRWYLWDGGFLAMGHSGGVVPPHAHHAIQITLGLGGMVRFRTEEHDWREMRGAVVLPDATHSFDGMNSLISMLFVDPESREGRWLRQSLREPITTVPDARMERLVPPLLRFYEAPLEALETAELIRHTVGHLCAGAPPSRTLDPRVTSAIAFMRLAETRGLRLEDVARTVFLSSSRFAHLFSENVGLPFRRYVLWRKLGRAMLSIGRGTTLSAAAQEGGFADAAHLTRTFHQMFGIPPSVMMKGEFFEVPSPFELEGT